MKIAGLDLQAPVEEVLVLPHGGNNVVFKARPVMDMENFEKFCPEPKAPIMTGRNNQRIANVNDPRYKRDVDNYAKNRMAYLIIRSLEATEGLQWETVKFDDPGTWQNYEQELKDAQFSSTEIGRIVMLVLSANCLDEQKIEAARKSFLVGQAVALGTPSGLSSEPETTPSGEPVPVSA